DGALHGRDRLQWVDVRESRETRHPLVEARVVLHGAGAQRIEARIDRVVLLGEPRVVPHHLRLREARQADWPLARDTAEAAPDCGRLRQVDPGAASRVLLEEQRLLDLQAAIAADGRTASLGIGAEVTHGLAPIAHDSTCVRAVAKASMSASVV